MADYIYLLETRLSPAQQRAIGTVRSAARENELTIFLTGGAVRDLTGGGSVRDLDLTIQGDALRLKQPLEAAGATVVGENTAAQQLFLTLPGSVRAEVSSAMRVTYPTPGKPVYEPSNISEALRSRDFTANAMAISLNEGSYGLLMDPLNGVADIENRELRLVNNYGFIEEPSRLIRAARLMSRLGWHMEERTRQRYDTAKDENYISALNGWHRGYETEEIFHEEDPLRVLRSLEAEGWFTHLFPALQAAKANTAGLDELADRQGQLQVRGIFAQSAALAFPLLTAKLAPAEVAALKGMFVRPGFVTQIESLDNQVRDFAARAGGKEAAAPSAAWKMLHEAEPNLVLALFANSKNGNVQARLKTFLSESPAARQRIPYTLLQEMRITPDLSEYQALLDRLFFELMDGRLGTTEEMKAFLEPYSPPAPPPPVSLRRAKAKKEARPSRAKAKKAAEPDAPPVTVAAEEEAAGVATGLIDVGDLTGPNRGPEPTPHVPLLGKVAPEPSAREQETVAPVQESTTRPESQLKPAHGEGKKAASRPSRPSKKSGSSGEKIPAQVEAVAISPQRVPAEVLPVSVQEVPEPVPAKAPLKGVPGKALRRPASLKRPVKSVSAKADGKASTPPKTSPKRDVQPAKKTAGTAKTVAIKPGAAKKASPAPQKTTPAKKSTPSAKKAAPAKKMLKAVKKAPVAKKVVAPAKKSIAVKKITAKSVVKKAAGRKR